MKQFKRRRPAAELRAGLLGALILLTAGCASIMSGSDQDVYISSRPDGARVTIYDGAGMEVWSSTTPVTATLDRGDGFFTGARYRVEIEKPGFEKKVIAVKSRLNGGWYLAGNFLLGGWIGWLIVDPATGAMWKLSPDDVRASLVQADQAFLKDGDEGFTVVLREEIDPYLFDHLPLEQVN
jgi:hypothetical protein